MKLAVSAQGSDSNAPIELRFGRAPFFLIVDTETGQQTVVDNASAANAVQGAGLRAVETLARREVQVVLTGHVGPKAWNALRAANIQVYPVTDGAVKQAVAAFLSGRLQPLSEAEVKGHW